MTSTLHEDLRTFMTISPSTLLSIRNVSDKRCREYQNTAFVQNMEKYGTAIQAADNNKAHALCTLDT